MNKKQRNEKGFTMVELIVVVAIMAIIGALLVPAFSQMSAKARATTDVSTIKTLKRTVDNYYASEGHYPNASSSPVPATDGPSLIEHLQEVEYLDNEPQLQTAKAGGVIDYDPDTGVVKLDLTGCSDPIITRQAGKLEEDTPGFVIGGTDASGAVIAEPADE